MKTTFSIYLLCIALLLSSCNKQDEVLITSVLESNDSKLTLEQQIKQLKNSTLKNDFNLDRLEIEEGTYQSDCVLDLLTDNWLIKENFECALNSLIATNVLNDFKFKNNSDIFFGKLFRKYLEILKNKIGNYRGGTLHKEYNYSFYNYLKYSFAKYVLEDAHAHIGNVPTTWKCLCNESQSLNYKDKEKDLDSKFKFIHKIFKIPAINFQYPEQVILIKYDADQKSFSKKYLEDITRNFDSIANKIKNLTKFEWDNLEKTEIWKNTDNNTSIFDSFFHTDELDIPENVSDFERVTKFWDVYKPGIHYFIFAWVGDEETGGVYVDTTFGVVPNVSKNNEFRTWQHDYNENKKWDINSPVRHKVNSNNNTDCLKLKLATENLTLRGFKFDILKNPCDD